MSLSINDILPAKLRILLGIHANSRLLGDLALELFVCIGELIEAKRSLIDALSDFARKQIESE